MLFALISPSAWTFARELTSLTDQNVNERIIDRFIQAHSKHFSNALGYKKALSKVELKWMDGDSTDPKSSSPDYLMQRKDGYFDILDLKTSMLKYNSLTRGGKSRCRFNAYVSELIAQLIGYERYFKRDKNSKWVYDTHGIKIQNPRLIGIVGNYDNFIREDVDLALEQYKDNITILSYADLTNLLRNQIPTSN